jgi:hypothetical protein
MPALFAPCTDCPTFWDLFYAYELRADQLRASRSEHTRQKIVEQLENSVVLVTIDFAMKLLPQKFRENQQEVLGEGTSPALLARRDGSGDG